MNTFSTARVAILFFAIAGTALTSAILSAQEIKVVSPSFLENAEGDAASSEITGGPGNLQYLSPASDFADLPESHRLIVGRNFRADVLQTEPVDWCFDDFKIWMSTTDKDNLTSVFDDNHGPDKKLVHDGKFCFPVLGTGPAEGPRDFADGTRLESPFYYDPSAGNLLVEILAPSYSEPYPGPRLDFQTTSELRVAFADGQTFYAAGVHQFTFIPEPTSASLAGLGLFGLAVWRRRGRV